MLLGMVGPLISNHWSRDYTLSVHFEQSEY